MQTKTLSQFTSCALLLSGAMLLGGCAGSSTDNSTNTATANSTPPNAASVSQTPATETSERSSTAPPVKPPPGFGNAQGRVLWNEKGAAGILVRLCGDISMVGGCTGKTYSAKTDKDGNYTVDKVPPGDYSLAVRIFDTDAFVYPTSGILSAAKFHIDKDKTLDIRATNLYKTDLQIVSPKAGEVVKTGSPKLTWKAYPGAAEYEVTLSSSGSENQTIKTASNSASPDQPLLNGDYTWKIEANNANGVKIAETNDSTPFKVTGQTGSNKVELTYPVLNSTVPGAGLKFTWKAHPLANGYQIYLNKVGGSSAILSFENVNGTDTSYPMTQTLDAGTYYWSINAMRDGKKLAASDLQSFKVK